MKYTSINTTSHYEIIPPFEHPYKSEVNENFKPDLFMKKAKDLYENSKDECEKSLAFCLAYEYTIDGELNQNQIYKFEKTYKKFKRELNSQTTFFYM